MSTQPYPYHNVDSPPPYNSNQPYYYPQSPAPNANIQGASAMIVPDPSLVPTYPPAGYPPRPPPPYAPYQSAGYPPQNAHISGSYYLPSPNTVGTVTTAPARAHHIGFDPPNAYQYKEANGMSTSSSLGPSPNRDQFNNNSATAPPSDTNLIGFQVQEGNLYPSIKTNDVKNVLKTPLPPNLVTLWQSSKPTNIYFVQIEGHVVSPKELLPFVVCKCPVLQSNNCLATGSLSGFADGATALITVGEVWRLGLKRDKSYIVKGMSGEYAFYDQSTNPARCVVVTLPKIITKDERQRLDVLLRASAAMIDEPTNVVEKFEGGMESAYDYVTNSVDSLVKKGTPTVHKNTKWLRKGTGSLVKFGGGIVSKGVHLVSDNVGEKQAPTNAFQEHKELIDALKKTRHAISSNKVSYIQPL